MDQDKVAQLDARDDHQQVQLDKVTAKTSGFGNLLTPAGIGAMFAGILSVMAAYKAMIAPADVKPAGPVQVEIVKTVQVEVLKVPDGKAAKVLVDPSILTDEQKKLVTPSKNDKLQGIMDRLK